MAYLKKRGGTWYACYYVNGIKIVRSTGLKITPHDSSPTKIKKLAQQTAEAMERVSKDGSVERAVAAVRYAASSLSIASEHASIEAFFKEEIKTRPSYSAPVNQFLQFLGLTAKKRLDVLRSSDFEAFFQAQAQTKRVATVKNSRMKLQALMQVAVKRGLVEKNVVKETSIPAPASDAHGKIEKQAFTIEELNLLLFRLPPMWSKLVRLSYVCGGLRLWDSAMLRWDAMDNDSGVLRIKPRKTRKYGTTLNIPLTPALRALLDSIPRENEYVFPKFAASCIKAGKSCTLSAQFARYLVQYGLVPATLPKGASGRSIAPLSFHSIRHTAVSQLRAAGVVPDIARSIVGHNSEQVERAYFHAPAEKLAQAYGTLFDSVKTQK